jgi:metal-responsive CopG/Arc/MetJ family transcriptional regulator
MEPSKKKPRKKFTITIDAELLNKFDEHVDSIGYDKSRLVEKIIMMYMKNYESNK